MRLHPVAAMTSIKISHSVTGCRVIDKDIKSEEKWIVKILTPVIQIRQLHFQ